MPLGDFLLPAENVRFAGDDDERVEYAEKRYRVYVTDRRLILYARRGLLLRSDDIVSERLEAIHGIKYKERFSIPHRDHIHHRLCGNRDKGSAFKDEAALSEPAIADK